MNVNNVGLKSTILPPLSNNRSVENGLLVKIKEIVLRIFKKIREIILFPTRFCGSKKRCKGYHFTMQKELTIQQTKELLPYACVNAATHSNNMDCLFGHHLVEFSDLPEINGIEKRENCYFNSQTGLKIAVYENEVELVIAYGALTAYKSELKEDSKLSIKGYLNCVGSLLGGVPVIFEEAERVSLELVKALSLKGGKAIKLSGQCYGGALASYVGLKNKINTIAMNTLPLGAGLQKKIGSEILDRADQFVTHISAKKDIVSDNRFFGALDKVASSIGIKTPGNFGKRYDIPSIYKTAKETHYYILGSMMHHLGKDPRAKPKDVL